MCAVGRSCRGSCSRRALRTRPTTSRRWRRQAPAVVQRGGAARHAGRGADQYRASREVAGQSPKATEVRGVRLLAVLEQAGLAERDRLDWRKTVVIAIARDGYRAVFSWPELANTAAAPR